MATVCVHHIRTTDGGGELRSEELRGEGRKEGDETQRWWRTLVCVVYDGGQCLKASSECFAPQQLDCEIALIIADLPLFFFPFSFSSCTELSC